MNDLIVEIALWDRRVGVSLSPEEPPDVAAVFEQQRDGLVLRMTLKEHEEAPSLFHERVDARLLRPRQHAIAAREEGLLGDLVPPGMRDSQTIRGGGCQRVVRHALAFEDAEALVAQRSPDDPVVVEDARVCRQT